MARENTKELPQRIAAKIRHNPATGCWEWTAHVGTGGYGMVYWGRTDDGRERTAYAHRLVYHLLVDADLPVFPGRRAAVLDHLCLVKRCVNPTHLVPVTQGENVRRYWETAERQQRAIDGLTGRSEITAGELAAANGMTHAEACRSLRKLERRGLVSIVGQRHGPSGRASNVWGAI